jgi:hypothetical protein
MSPTKNLLPYLQESLAQIPELRKEADADAPAFIEWQEMLEGVMERQYGEKSREYKAFTRIKYDDYAKGLTKVESKLKSMIKQLVTFGSKLDDAPKSNGTEVHIHNVNTNTVNQHQSQHQETKIDLDRQIEELLKYLKEQHPEKVEEAKTVLEPLKSGNQKNVLLDQIKQAIQFFLPLGENALLVISFTYNAIFPA